MARRRSRTAADRRSPATRSGPSHRPSTTIRSSVRSSPGRPPRRASAVKSAAESKSASSTSAPAVSVTFAPGARPVTRSSSGANAPLPDVVTSISGLAAAPQPVRARTAAAISAPWRMRGREVTPDIKHHRRTPPSLRTIINSVRVGAWPSPTLRARARAGCGIRSRARGVREQRRGGEDDGRITVVASTSVYGQIAEEIGGDLVDVTSIVSSTSQDPHSFEPSAQDQLAVRHADLVIENGGGYDAFIDALLEASGSTAPVLTAVEFSAAWPGGAATDSGRPPRPRARRGLQRARLVRRRGDGRARARDPGEARGAEPRRRRRLRREPRRVPGRDRRSRRASSPRSTQDHGGDRDLRHRARAAVPHRGRRASRTSPRMPSPRRSKRDRMSRPRRSSRR